jgi:hypothetical protein
MNKREAIEAMKNGLKVTHKYFDPKEWITMSGKSTIMTEEGYAVCADKFWNGKDRSDWEFDWSVWNAPKPFRS